MGIILGFTRESGKRGLSMGTGLLSLKMAIVTKVIGNKGTSTDKVS